MKQIRQLDSFKLTKFQFIVEAFNALHLHTERIILFAGKCCTPNDCFACQKSVLKDTFVRVYNVFVGKHKASVNSRAGVDMICMRYLLEQVFSGVF